jgi:dolichyl-diphosphooligosaccharide--protein glycosyltransferase
MELKNPITKENVVNGLKKLGNLRVKVDHSTIMTISALTLILFVAFGVRILPLRWEIQSGSLHLSEFDPYHQYRFTEYIVNNGFISWIWPEPWIDNQRWYPQGAPVATTALPGLPLTAAFFYKIISLFSSITLRDFCVIFPPIMGALTCLALYFFGKDVGGKKLGMLAALLLALSPSYIQRTSIGFFDDETVGIFALILFSLFFLRSIDADRPVSSTVKYAVATGLVLGYFTTAWGAALYPVGITGIFVFVMILLKRYSQRIFLSYSVTFGLGLLIAINVPSLGTRYLMTFTVLPVLGLFALLCIAEVNRVTQTTKWKLTYVVVFLAGLVASFAVLWLLGYMQSVAGKFISVLNPFTREASPLIESVAEHRISAWGSIYYDLGIGIIFFATGLFFVIGNLNNRNLFLLIYGLTSLYFASSMVRLLVLMAPAFCLLAATGVTGLLKPFSMLLREPPKISVKKKLGLEYVGKEFSGVAVLLIFIILMSNLAFPSPKVFRQAYAPVTITAGSLSIAPNEPVAEWLNMLDWTKNNLDSKTVVCSWWDYGYWLTILGNVTSLADNATINSTQIQNVGFIFVSNETQALKMLKRYNVSYILVFVTFDINGNWIDWAGGDNGKWTWMARISGSGRDRLINKEKMLDEKSSWVNETRFGFFNSSARGGQGGWQWNGTTGMTTVVYKLMAWGKYRWCQDKVSDPEQAEWQRENLTAANIMPVYFKEAYFAGVDLLANDAKSKYGGIVPLVCLYEIDWAKYYNDFPSP